MRKIMRGFRRKREKTKGKKANNGEFREPRKISSNLSVFLALVLKWLV